MTNIHLPRRGAGGKLETFRAGHIFLLPQGATWLNHDKPRPFALASPCSPSRLGTIVYGSTRDTERQWNAACVVVTPSTAGVNANGLRASTVFYPGVMSPAAYGQLPAHTGFLAGALREFRGTLRRALGIGTGTCLRPGAPSRSRRGRIVRLMDDIATDLRTRYGVLLTEHEYSQERRYQLLIPLLRAEAFRSWQDSLLATNKDWMEVFDQPTAAVLLPAHLIQSVWHGDDVADETAFVIDEATLGAIEADLCARFALAGA